MTNPDQTTSALLDALEREKAKIRESLPELERDRDAAWDALQAAAAEQSKAWDLVVKKSGKDGRMDAVPDDVKAAAYATDKKHQQADTTFTNYDVRLRKAVARLRDLESPEALDKLRDKRSGLKKLRESRPAKPTAKDQGFPDVYLAESGNFKPGYDSKAKSDLTAFLNNRVKKDALHQFRSADVAWKLVEARGWEKYMLPAKPPVVKAA